MFGKSNRGKSFIAGCGFMLAAIAPLGSAHATGYKVLYSFKGGSDGEYPATALTREPVSGRLYGTTVVGGASGYGTIFALDAGGTETVLYSFTGGADGWGPSSHALLDKAGNLFTTASQGGNQSCNGGCGTIFELKADGTTNAVPFNGSNGAYPYGDLIADSAGNLYGTAYEGGGSKNCSYGCGTVFEYQPGGAIKTLYSFSGVPDGRNPQAGLIQDAAGNFYGTTTAGGAYNYNAGTIFKLATDGTETVLYSFCSQPYCSDGASPSGGVLMNVAGDLFTTTARGGARRNCPPGCGTIFELKADGSTNVVSFDKSNGKAPLGGVIADSAGNLYGATNVGGTFHRGTVFAYPPGGAITPLHSFARDTQDGEYPEAGLIADGAGHLYGTTFYGGAYGFGTVFKVAE